MAVSSDGAVLHHEFGAPSAHGIAPEETLVDVGSATKAVTAFATLKLVEQGGLGLDETLGAILPDVPADKAGITVRQLLTHTAGMPGAVGDDFEALGRDALVERAMGTDLVHPPGGPYDYSNVGFSLLAAAVERRSGKPFEQYLQEDVLTPAGLGGIGYDSVYDDDRALRWEAGPLTGGEALSVRDASWGGGSPGWNLVGNGGMVATPSAYIAFVEAARAGRIVGVELTAEAFAPQVDEGFDDIESFYGFGLVVEEIARLGTVYWHDGGNDVFSAEWRALGAEGAVLFTAGTGEDGFEAMSLLLDARTPAPIPVPGGLPLLVGALGALILARRRVSV